MDFETEEGATRVALGCILILVVAIWVGATLYAAPTLVQYSEFSGATDVTHMAVDEPKIPEDTTSHDLGYTASPSHNDYMASPRVEGADAMNWYFGEGAPD